MAIDNDAPKTPKLAQRIEPGLRDDVFMIERSAAVSLKRGADALERIADALETIAANSAEAAYDAVHSPVDG